MDIEEFQKIVNESVESLPDDFKKEIDNVDIAVELWPTDDDLRSIFAHPGITLFGLYRGIPKTKRGNYYSGVLPDKIVIFAGPILRFSNSVEDAKKQIKKTVLHEIGHYFGMTEKAIRQAQQDYE